MLGNCDVLVNVVRTGKGRNRSDGRYMLAGTAEREGIRKEYRSCLLWTIMKHLLRHRFRTVITFSVLLSLAIVHLFHCFAVYSVVKNTPFPSSRHLRGQMREGSKENGHKETGHGEITPGNINGSYFNRKHPFDCTAIFSGDTSEALNATATGRRRMTEYEMANIYANCSLFRQRHFYASDPMSNAEAAFPLAFVILLNEHLEQIELLFSAIYAPQNIYCFHVDFKAPFVIHYAIQKLASCFPDQVSLDETPLPISRESVNSLHAIKNCFRKSISINRSWKYALTLQGHDFPLRTNREIVEILSLHGDMNDVELTEGQPERYELTYDQYTDKLGQPVGLWPRKAKKRPPIPDQNLILYKGNVAGALSRQFVEFILDANISKELLKWLNGSLMPDELFFSTLNHNEFLDAPGGYPGGCIKMEGAKSWVSRFTVWEWYSDEENHTQRNITCHGAYRNGICLCSASDLPMLAGRRELFLNKFWITKDPVAIDCMQEYLHNRTRESAINKDWELPYLAYYMDLAAVKFSQWKMKYPKANISEFPCATCHNCEH